MVVNLEDVGVFRLLSNVLKLFSIVLPVSEKCPDGMRLSMLNFRCEIPFFQFGSLAQ